MNLPYWSAFPFSLHNWRIFASYASLLVFRLIASECLLYFSIFSLCPSSKRLKVIRRVAEKEKWALTNQKTWSSLARRFLQSVSTLRLVALTCDAPGTVPPPLAWIRQKSCCDTAGILFISVASSVLLLTCFLQHFKYDYLCSSLFQQIFGGLQHSSRNFLNSKAASPIELPK